MRFLGGESDGGKVLHDESEFRNKKREVRMGRAGGVGLIAQNRERDKGKEKVGEWGEGG